MEKLPATRIDSIKTEYPEVIIETENRRTSPASIALELGALAMAFARVERVPRYTEEARENDAEHSYMLALVANELAARMYPKLNAGLVTQFAIVHDLIETVTGDVATFHHSAEQMAAKQLVEHAALNQLVDSLPVHTGQLLNEYEKQQQPEARFVKAVDKLLPVIVDILGHGKKVMREDYGVTTTEDLVSCQEKLHTRIANSFGEFPPIVTAHEFLCELFELEFGATDS